MASYHHLDYDHRSLLPCTTSTGALVRAENYLEDDAYDLIAKYAPNSRGFTTLRGVFNNLILPRKSIRDSCPWYVS